MGDKRQFRSPGDILLLGQTWYRLESVEGCGGSAIVYRASYEDQLNRAFRHYVFIKELFPYHPKGNIYRNESGEICCRGDGGSIMEYHKQNFYQGNQANLKLLEQAPEIVSGNLNSYQAYGTFYSVLAVHGGNCLETVLESGQSYGTLRETAEVILKVLDAVECFHKSGILHLDISPDNILLLPQQALLIDYNSVWEINGQCASGCCLSEKEGYAAPEIRLREYKNIGRASDLYSVCAVWFRMLTGHRLTDEEIIGNRLREKLCQDLAVFRDEPLTAVQKAKQILAKGLHVLARRRYQSAEQMREDVEELIQRIDRRGISHNAVWECSRREWESIRRNREEGYQGERNSLYHQEKQGKLEEIYLERRIRMQEGTECEQEVYKTELQKGGRFLLTGAGGMGKTSFLMRLWEQAVAHYQPAEPVILYIPLIGYQEAGEETYYIRKYVLRHICLQGQPDSLDTAVHELDRQLDLSDSWRLILLLDGLNEAGYKKYFLLKEIEELGKKPSVGILITDRSTSVKKYGLYGFCTAELLPLTETQVAQVLQEDAVEKIDIKLYSNLYSNLHSNLLCNPMMLFLYRRAIKLIKETGKSTEGFSLAEEMDMDRLIGVYLDSLYIWQQRIDSGNQAQQLRHQYLIYHFLPEIAAEMKRRRKTLLNLDELYVLAQRTYKRLGNKDFAMAFPEYLGKSRLILDGINDAMEWFDYAVEEQLVRHFNLMQKSGERTYCLAHDNYIKYLAGKASKNRKRTAVYKSKIWGKKAGLLLVLVSMFAVGSIYVRRDRLAHQFSEQELYQLREVLYQAGRNLGALGTQIQIQQQVLDKAANKEVLEGETQAIGEFREWLAHKQQEANQYSFERSKNKSALESLEKTGVELPFLVLEDLIDKTFEMDILMEEGLSHLAEHLDKKVLSYTDREELVTFYQEYLEAYAEVVYRELVMVLVSLDDDMESELLDIIGQMAVFKGYIRMYPYEGKSTKVLETELDTARAHMRDCRNHMKTRNYQISLPDWQ